MSAFCGVYVALRIRTNEWGDLMSRLTPRVTPVAAIVAVLLLHSPASAHERVLSFSSRLGPIVSTFNQRATVISNSGEGDLLAYSEATESHFSSGAQLGFTTAFGNFFYDLGIEYLEVAGDRAIRGDIIQSEDGSVHFDRTDVLFTLGHLIGERWVGFAGYRRGLQGDGFMRSDALDEEGLFGGVSVGGLEIGGLAVAVSAARIRSKVLPAAINNIARRRIDDDIDYGGLSLKLTVSPTRAPQHSFVLRYQQFDGGDQSVITVFDPDSNSPVDISSRFDFKEKYLQLLYIYSLAAFADK